MQEVKGVRMLYDNKILGVSKFGEDTNWNRVTSVQAIDDISDIREEMGWCVIMCLCRVLHGLGLLF